MALIHLESAQQRLARHTGVVVPVFVPTNAEAESACALIHGNVRTFVALVENPAQVCVSVDGCTAGERLAEALRAELGVSVVVNPVNQGKLGAARQGVLALLDAFPGLEAIAVVDQDGDHFANELLTLIRSSLHVEAEAGTTRVLVIGARNSLHHPMGFGRGELEDFADRVLLDALHFHAAASGTPLPLQYASLHGEAPDFHSGYKVFTRETAEAVFRPEPVHCCLDPSSSLRHAVEAHMCVEAVLSGAVIAQALRSTVNEQPISTFGQLDAAALTADMIAWPCLRLGVPGAFVAQWMQNHLPRIRMGTMVPDGRDTLRRVYEGVMRAYGEALSPPAGAPPLI